MTNALTSLLPGVRTCNASSLRHRPLTSGFEARQDLNAPLSKCSHSDQIQDIKSKMKPFPDDTGVNGVNFTYDTADNYRSTRALFGKLNDIARADQRAKFFNGIDDVQIACFSVNNPPTYYVSGCVMWKPDFLQGAARDIVNKTVFLDGMRLPSGHIVYCAWRIGINPGIDKLLLEIFRSNLKGDCTRTPSKASKPCNNCTPYSLLPIALPTCPL